MARHKNYSKVPVECRKCCKQIVRNMVVRVCGRCSAAWCAACYASVRKEGEALLCTARRAEASVQDSQAAEVAVAAMDTDAGDIDSRLEFACAEPAMHTLVSLPPEMERRALTQCVVALHAMVAACMARYPDEAQIERTSRWAWLMPALLMRKPCAPSGRAGHSGDAGDAGQAAAADLSLAKVLRSWMQKAELGEWAELLEEYINEREERRDRMPRTSSVPMRDSEEERHE